MWQDIYSQGWYKQTVDDREDLWLFVSKISNK